VSLSVGGARAVSVAATSVAIAPGAIGGVAPGKPTGPQANPVRTTQSNARRIFRETKGLPRMRMDGVHYIRPEAVHNTRWADGDWSVRMGPKDVLDAPRMPTWNGNNEGSSPGDPLAASQKET